MKIIFKNIKSNKKLYIKLSLVFMAILILLGIFITSMLNYFLELEKAKIVYSTNNYFIVPNHIDNDSIGSALKNIEHEIKDVKTLDINIGEKLVLNGEEYQFGKRIVKVVVVNKNSDFFPKCAIEREKYSDKIIQYGALPQNEKEINLSFILAWFFYDSLSTTIEKENLLNKKITIFDNENENIIFDKYVIKGFNENLVYFSYADALLISELDDFYITNKDSFNSTKLLYLKSFEEVNAVKQILEEKFAGEQITYEGADYIGQYERVKKIGQFALNLFVCVGIPIIGGLLFLFVVQLLRYFYEKKKFWGILALEGKGANDIMKIYVLEMLACISCAVVISAVLGTVIIKLANLTFEMIRISLRLNMCVYLGEIALLAAAIFLIMTLLFLPMRSKLLKYTTREIMLYI